MSLLTDFKGRQIRLTDERLNHVLEHHEMVDLTDQIGKTLLNPEKVVRSSSDETVSLYYRYQQETKVGPKWLCVVVKHGERGAFVLTSYLTDTVKKGVSSWPVE